MTDKEFKTIIETEELANRRNYSIAIANEVIDKMRNGLSAQQHDVLDYLFSQIKATDTPDTEYTVSIKEYCRVAHIQFIEDGKNYRDIKDAVKELNNNCRWITIGNKQTALIYWLSNIVLDEEKATLSYHIDSSVAPYLFGLIKTGHYTQYSYRDTRALNSKYAKSLYVILKRYIDCKIYNPIIPLDKIKQQLAAEKYTLYKDFRKWVIETALTEINAKTFIRAKLGNGGKPYKAAGSRAATHITFELEYVKSSDVESEEREWNNKKAFGEDILELPY